jgi:sugar phosphate isomerase/epimerase
MRISCSSLFLWDYGIEEIIEILTLAGIESLEFWAETPEFWRHRHESGAVESLKDTISTLCDHCTVHAPILDLNAASYNEHVCKATITETLWAIDLTLHLDASILTIHPGNRTVRRRPIPDEWERFYHYLTVCTDYADQMGVTLALENLTPKIQSMCHNPLQMGDVMARYPTLRMTLDIPHALKSGVDNAMGFINTLNDRIVNVHVGDVHRDTPHYPGHLGQNPETTDVLRKLQNCGYNNDLTIEIDDKLLDGCQSKLDKISLLINEKRYLIQEFKKMNEV